MMPLSSPPSAAASCALCGENIPAGAPFGQCPQCLFGLGSGNGLAGGIGEELLSAVNIRVFGDYELLEEIARGGMGVVYRARQLSLGREVAVKMILAGELATEESVLRFRNEAAAAARLDHPHIVPVYEIGEHETQHYFSMRLVPGGMNVARWAAALRLPPAERAASIAVMMAKVARAVAFAHGRGVLHRDLKPSNILTDAADGPQVTDFGLAKLMDEQSNGLTLSRTMLGSPSYMAPEQADGSYGDVTTATDVYGLGAVLYELLSGNPPFTGKSPFDVMRKVAGEMPAPLPGIPRDAATIALKCLAREPGQRYVTALELAEDLERFARGEGIHARPVTGLEAAWRWARIRPKVAALLAALLMALILGFAGVTWQWRLAEAAREGEARERNRATETAADLYTNAGLTSSREEDPTRAALWFAQAAAMPGAGERSRAASLARWAAWRGDSVVPVRAFVSGVGTAGAAKWNPGGNALIVTRRKSPEERQIPLHAEHVQAAIHDLANETRWQPGKKITSAAWCDGGKTLVMAGPGAVELVEFPSGQAKASLPSDKLVACLAVSADGRWIAVGTTPPFLWEPLTGKTVPLPDGAGQVVGLEFSRDGRRLLVTGVFLRGVCLLDQPQPFLFPPLESVGGAEQGFLDQGSLFIALNKAGQLLVMDSGTGAVVETYPSPGETANTPFRISRDGRFIACKSFPLLARPEGNLGFPTHSNLFEALDFSGDGTLLISGGWDDKARLWDLAGGTAGRTLGWHQEGVTGVAISPDKRYAATCQWAGDLVRIWRLQSAPAGRVIPESSPSRACLSKDGTLLALRGRPDYGNRTRSTRVYSVAGASPVGPEIFPTGDIMDAAFSPDGAWLAIVTGTLTDRSHLNPDDRGSGTLEWWDFRQGRRIGGPVLFDTEPRAMAFRPDGKKIAVYGARRTLHEVDTGTGQVRQWHTNSPDVKSGPGENAECAYSPDGRMLFTWGLDQPPLAIDCLEGKKVAVPAWQSSIITNLDFYDGQVVSSSLDSVMDFHALPGMQPSTPTIRDTN